MKFREYGEVKPITITSKGPLDLDERIEEIGNEYDIIDLQFAISGKIEDDTILYSALLLVKEK